MYWLEIKSAIYLYTLLNTIFYSRCTTFLCFRVSVWIFLREDRCRFSSGRQQQQRQWVSTCSITILDRRWWKTDSACNLFIFSDTSTWLKCKCRAIIWGSHRRSFHDETQPRRPRASQRLIVPRRCLRPVSLLYFNPVADDSSYCKTSTNTETTHIHTDLKIYLNARTHIRTDMLWNISTAIK